MYLCIFNPHPRKCSLILERQIGRETERNIDQLPPVRAPNGDWTLNLRMCPAQRSNPQLFWCTGWCSHQLSHTARAKIYFLEKEWYELCTNFQEPGKRLCALSNYKLLELNTLPFCLTTTCWLKNRTVP